MPRSEEHTSELQSLRHLVCRLLLDSATTCSYTLSLHDALPICHHVRASEVGEHPAEGGGASNRGERDGVEEPGVDEVAGQPPDVAASEGGNDHEHDVDRTDHAEIGRAHV